MAIREESGDSRRPARLGHHLLRLDMSDRPELQTGQECPAYGLLVLAIERCTCPL